MNPVVFTASCGLFGLLFGSFANVIIWRLPRGESLASPGSHCPSCDTSIAWGDNIPVISWLVLRGKCRACGVAISPRYAVVEMTSAALWILAALAFGPTIRTGFAIAFYYLLLVLSAIDLETRRLPNPLVATLVVVGAVGVGFTYVFKTACVPLIDVPGGAALFSLAGALVSSGTAAGIALLYGMARKVDGLGMGDVKLLFAIGLFLGPYGLMVLFLASLFGAVFGIIASTRSSDGLMAKIPFGPYLAASAVAVSIWGPPVWVWYRGFLG